MEAGLLSSGRFFEGRSFGRDDGSTSKQALAVVEDRRLARRNSIFGRGEDHSFAIPMAGDGPGKAADFGFDVSLIFRKPVDAIDLRGSDCERAARSNDQPALLGLDPHDVERLLLAADLDAAALADGEVDHALMLTQDAACQVNDPARRGRFRP